jgi:hypothetical protein
MDYQSIVFWKRFAYIAAVPATLLAMSALGPLLQRQAFYAHNVNPVFYKDQNKPEKYGFHSKLPSYRFKDPN